MTIRRQRDRHEGQRLELHRGRLPHVDDFESYTDNMDANEAISRPGPMATAHRNGSQVGYTDSPFAKGFGTADASPCPSSTRNLGASSRVRGQAKLTSPQDWSVHGLAESSRMCEAAQTTSPCRCNVTSPTRPAAAHRGERGREHRPGDGLAEWSIAFGVRPPLHGQVETLVIASGPGHPTNGEGIVYVDDIQVRVPRNSPTGTAAMSLAEARTVAGTDV